MDKTFKPNLFALMFNDENQYMTSDCLHKTIYIKQYTQI